MASEARTVVSAVADVSVGEHSREAGVSLGLSSTEILVVRHGETEWNADGRIQGHLDVDLNENGRRQGAAVAARLSRNPGISAVYSSDLKRAYDTAEMIGKQCGGLKVVADVGLRERNMGVLQGRLYRELHGHYKEIPGDGESVDQLDRRCMTTFEKIGKKHEGKTVVVVTHGGVIRSLIQQVDVNMRVRRVHNTSVTLFSRACGGGDWTIPSLPDDSHLKDVGHLESAFGGTTTTA